MRFVTSFTATALATFLAGPASAATAPSNPLPKVKQVVVARQHSKIEILQPQAVGDVLAWLERGKRGTRIAVRSGDHTRRSSFRRKVNTFRLHHGVDARTGQPALRVELGVCRATLRCSLTTTLNPRSLRRSSIRWAAEPHEFDLWSGEQPSYWYGDGIGAIVDGDTQLTYRDTPEAAVPATGDWNYVGRMRSTGCDLRAVTGTPAIPVLHDCGSMRVAAHNRLVAVHADVPSQTTEDHYDTRRRLDVFDLGDPAAGWRRVGSAGYGKGGSFGVQAWCLLDDGIAVLSGTSDAYIDSPAETWQLAVIPLRPGGKSWQAATPRLVEAATLVCTARDVYAVDAKGRNLVRLVRPKHAPAAGPTAN